MDPIRQKAHGSAAVCSGFGRLRVRGESQAFVQARQAAQDPGLLTAAHPGGPFSAARLYPLFRLRIVQQAHLPLWEEECHPGSAHRIRKLKRRQRHFEDGLQQLEGGICQDDPSGCIKLLFDIAAHPGQLLPDRFDLRAGASLILNERRVFDTAMARVAISGRGIAAKGDGAGAFWGSGAYEGARISG